jgi:esterase/lipase superfamily enzyme
MFKKILKTIAVLALSLVIFGCSTKVQNLPQKEPIKKSEPTTLLQAGGTTSQLPKSPPNPTNGAKVDSLYKLYYGTNREPIDLNDSSKGYGDKRANRLYTGSCKIFIPASHKVGEIDGSLWEKIVHLDMSYGEIKLKSIDSYKSSDMLWERLRGEFKHLKNREALIFIHGYNNTFESSAIRAGQIGYDLNFKGIMAFYSWPSLGTTMGYTADEASVQASEKYLKEFLVGFVQKSKADKVNIIAHSMGNRALIRAINDIQKEHPTIRFGQIILAAPDVDADLFKNIADAYTKISDRTTLYVSSEDKAVKLSKIKHSYPRAGLVAPVTVVNNIDTVNVNIDFETLFSKFINLNHTYFAKEKKILKDINNLLNNKTDSSIRKISRNRNNQEYLEIK